MGVVSIGYTSLTPFVTLTLFAREGAAGYSKTGRAAFCVLQNIIVRNIWRSIVPILPAI